MKLLSWRKDREEHEKTTASSKVDVAAPRAAISYRRIILRPLVTEKSAHLSSLGKYVFEVAADANRVAVQKAVADKYGIRPEAVHVLNVRGEYVRAGRHVGKTKSWKKAIVTLPKGQKIDVHEGV